ncbi:uncharacterized protein LOC126260461 [Schistocerca nitens]|uniref:uncharacterized protein LOC126260461 n=1 Tax=Schistocerca nitens TaxID=7011 RepID=UPI002118483D|nr:uncharacterized protein LOC126260461 [Schistocerca nitens]
MKPPLVSEGKTNGENQENKHIEFAYREAIGSLLYLLCQTRPDLGFTVNYESCFTENPKKRDYKNVKRTLRYLQGSKNYALFYKKKESEEDDSIHLKVYCDADYAQDLIDRKSTSAYIVLYNGAPISWCSKKQSVIATSSTEAEYISAAECTK